MTRGRQVGTGVALIVSGLVVVAAIRPWGALAQASPEAAGCAILPPDDIWNTPIDTLPVDPQSDAWIETIGADASLRADFGGDLWEGAPIGIPWADVPDDQPLVPVSFGYQDESDPGPYPIPSDAPIEGGPNSDGDRHVLVIKRDSCMLYELFNAFPGADGSWEADSGAVYDLASSALRPDGWTSADAAGLPILPGLTRYDEVAAGEIRHALRFTVPDTQRAYVWPARHFASDLTGPEYPPLGQRFRLRADFDVTGFSPDVQVILRALQRYGMMLADNGQAWFLSGAPDERWDDEVLQELRQVQGTDFEAVDVSSLMADPDSGQVVAQAPVDGPAASPPDSAAPEADVFVDASNASGTEDGTAAAPFSSLRAAIEAAADGATIAVAAGSYPENVRIEGRTLHLHGGYAADFSERDPIANVTAIQGDGTDSVVTLIDAGASTIDGFWISGGGPSRTPEYGHVGAGLYLSGGAPTIVRNVIDANDARPARADGNDVLGGGLFASDSDVSILDNVIRENIAGRGGGIAINGGRVLIQGNTIEDNIGVSDHGGGLYLASPDVQVTHNRIAGNEIGRELGYGWGGGIIMFGQGTNARLSLNDITANWAPSVGGGVFVDDGAVALLEHDVVHDNRCPTGGTTGGVGIYVDGYDTIGSRLTLDHVTVAGHDCATAGGNALYVEVNSAVTIANSIVWANGGDDFLVDGTSRVDAAYTLAEEPLPGEGNLSTDPLFADLGGQDYHLRSVAGRWDPAIEGWTVDDEHSPAIDAADPAAPYGSETEPNGGRADMGAYGNTPEASRSGTGA